MEGQQYQPSPHCLAEEASVQNQKYFKEKGRVTRKKKHKTMDSVEKEVVY